jgi:hypothetical protein
VEESIVKFWVASVCRFGDCKTHLLNPNEVCSKLISFTFIIINFVSIIQTDLAEDESLLHYIKLATSCGADKKLEDGDEQPPCKKLCPNENKALHQVLESVSDGDFAELMNIKRSRFNIKIDTSKLEDDDTDIEFEKRLVNAVCDPEVLDLIVRKLLSRSS